MDSENRISDGLAEVLDPESKKSPENNKESSHHAPRNQCQDVFGYIIFFVFNASVCLELKFVNAVFLAPIQAISLIIYQYLRFKYSNKHIWLPVLFGLLGAYFLYKYNWMQFLLPVACVLFTQNWDSRANSGDRILRYITMVASAGVLGYFGSWEQAVFPFLAAVLIECLYIKYDQLNPRIEEIYSKIDGKNPLHIVIAVLIIAGYVYIWAVKDLNPQPVFVFWFSLAAAYFFYELKVNYFLIYKNSRFQLQSGLLFAFFFILMEIQIIYLRNTDLQAFIILFTTKLYIVFKYKQAFEVNSEEKLKIEEYIAKIEESKNYVEYKELPEEFTNTFKNFSTFGIRQFALIWVPLIVGFAKLFSGLYTDIPISNCYSAQETQGSLTLNTNVALPLATCVTCFNSSQVTLNAFHLTDLANFSPWMLMLLFVFGSILIRLVHLHQTRMKMLAAGCKFSYSGIYELHFYVLLILVILLLISTKVETLSALEVFCGQSFGVAATNYGYSYVWTDLLAFLPLIVSLGFELSNPEARFLVDDSKNVLAKMNIETKYFVKLDNIVRPLIVIEKFEIANPKLERRLVYSASILYLKDEGFLKEKSA